jgi:hypothetical protein
MLAPQAKVAPSELDVLISSSVFVTGMMIIVILLSELVGKPRTEQVSQGGVIMR